jgi:hypothetical protein
MREGEYARRASDGAVAHRAVLRARVVDALARIEMGERDSLDGLQVALCAFVGALRAEGASAAEVAARVRELVAAPAAPHAHPLLPPTVRGALVELAEEWCAAEYARGAAGERGGESS